MPGGRIKGSRNLRAWERERLLTELAIGDSSDAELAAEFGIGEACVVRNRRDHKDWIDAKLAEWREQYDPQWFTQKERGLAVLNQRLEEVQSIITAMFDDARRQDERLRKLAESTGETYSGEVLVDGREYRNYARLQKELLREIWDATGQLPQRAGKLDVNVSNPFAGVDAVYVDDDGTVRPLVRR